MMQEKEPMDPENRQAMIDVYAKVTTDAINRQDWEGAEGLVVEGLAEVSKTIGPPSAQLEALLEEIQEHL
jgi:hypothetical protein